MNVLELSEQEIGRRQSLQELRDMGINPYPAAEFPVDAYSTDIKKEFKEDEKREVVIAGRMMSRRVMGKASFTELQDSKGRIQVYVTRDDICPDENKDLYNKVFKKLLNIIFSLISSRSFLFPCSGGVPHSAKFPSFCNMLCFVLVFLVLLLHVLGLGL